MSEAWEKRQDQVINGKFPLRRLLGCTDHSGVFLTEFTARNLPDAALKLVPAAGSHADNQLALWKAAAALSHPHLMQLFEAGRCEIEGLPFIFVVMDYAEQTLAQLLPQRALTPDEVREMLRPTLASLGFLHGRQWVQGALKPSNILVVGDQIKLASDTIRPTGESAPNIAQLSVYDPPETIKGSYSTASDVWSLGVTMFEALTQRPPASADTGLYRGDISATFPEFFARMVRQCLNSNPTERPTVADLEFQLEPVLPAPVPQASAPRPTASWPKRRVFIAALVLVPAVVLMVWAGTRNSHPPVPPAPTVVTMSDSKPAPSLDSSRHLDQPAPSAARISHPVLHEEIPDIPRSARNTIRGRIKVAVRVAIDSAGNVTHAALQTPGASKYFDHLATQAAGKWKFAPAERQDPRQTVVTFEFTRSGTVAHASPSQL